LTFIANVDAGRVRLLALWRIQLAFGNASIRLVACSRPYRIAIVEHLFGCVRLVKE